jgi:predicted O-methyltransferase YrrM
MMRNDNIINKVVIDYLEGLYTPLTPQLARLREDSEEKIIPVILKDTERLLDVLLRMTRPSRILEIGTAVGYSASCFAEICGPDTQIVTMEYNPQMAEVAQKNIEALGYQDQITIVQGNAVDTIKDLTGDFDFVFIDAGKSHYLEFWHGIMKNCHPGTVIVCDNVLMRAKTASDEYDPKHKFRTNIRHMREFLEFITTTDTAVTSVFSAGDGVSISVLVGEIHEKNGTFSTGR